jgi:hypothetical protein
MSPTFSLNRQSPIAKAKLVVVDECSMVDEALGRDLMSFGTPILVLGDPAQLPPISGGGFFTEHEPDHLLTEIHRQARDNPIIRLAHGCARGQGVHEGRLRHRAGDRARGRRQRSGAFGRPGAGRHQPDAAALQPAPARTEGVSTASCRRPATSWCACATIRPRGC